MVKRLVPVLLAALLGLGFVAGAGASVEWLVTETLDLDAKPLDVATSADGLRTFVLTEGGNILIYSAEGQLEDKIATGGAFDGIALSPRGDQIYLQSGKDRVIKIVSLDFVQKIDETGSPVKGLPDAPVAVAVYSDFQ